MFWVGCVPGVVRLATIINSVSWEFRFEIQLKSVSVVTVVGAGRGPLVTCVLTALKRSDRKARVYAVEKNLSALVT